MTLYRLKAVLEWMHSTRRLVTINEVAKGVEMSWNTAKKDLDELAEGGYLIKKKVGASERYKFNFKGVKQ